MAIQSKSERVRLPNQRPVCSFALNENNGKPFSRAFYSTLPDCRVFEECCRRNEIERIVENGREKGKLEDENERKSIDESARMDCRDSYGQRCTTVSIMVRERELRTCLAR